MPEGKEALNKVRPAAHEKLGVCAANLSGFRMVGVFDPKRLGTTTFIRRIIESLPLTCRRHVRVITSSGPIPAVTCAYLGGLSPPVMHHSRPDGSLLILDGEIYNTGRTGSFGDRSVRVYSNMELFDRFYKYGSVVAKSVDFAGSIVTWNEHLNQLSLYRDRSGIVPIYWTVIDSSLVWSSSMTAVHAAGVSKEPFLPAVDFFLASSFVPSPWTFVQNVHKVPPAHYLHWDGTGDTELDPYWRPTGQPKLALDERDRTGRLSGLLTKAVERRIGPDGRIGVLLSGGIDSTLLLGIAAHKIGAKVDTFTFDYTNYTGELNETAPARRAANFFGSKHHEIAYSPHDFADNFANMVRNYGEPLTYGVHSYLLGGVIKNGIPALMVGTGPDGWSLYDIERYSLTYAKAPVFVRNMAKKSLDLVCPFMPNLTSKLQTLQWCARTNFAATLATPVADDCLRSSLFRDNVYPNAGQHIMPEHSIALMKSMEEEDRHDRLTYSGLIYYSAEAVLYWNHQWSRTYNIPIRHPYFDDDVFAFLMRLPRRDHGKIEFRQVAAEFMPDDLAFAPKVYQALPIETWFRGALKSFVTDHLAPDRIRRVGLFDERVIERLINQHFSGQSSYHWLLLAIMAINEWLEQS